MRGKVLIVEDYTDWRELLAGMLQREGHTVQTAATLREAHAILQQIRDLDLAILDIRLVETDESNEDGMELLAEIHGQQGFTQVIMITGHGTMERQRMAFRRFKAFDFFRKEQFDSDEFRHGVQEAVTLAARVRQEQRERDYMHDHHYRRWRRDSGVPPAPEG
ncbi:MAG: response regulator [Desulfobacterales bacterium]|nr:response regulator [Desulfobacterales bacterium]